MSQRDVDPLPSKRLKAFVLSQTQPPQRAGATGDVIEAPTVTNLMPSFRTQAHNFHSLFKLFSLFNLFVGGLKTGFRGATACAAAPAGHHQHFQHRTASISLHPHAAAAAAPSPSTPSSITPSSLSALKCQAVSFTPATKKTPLLNAKSAAQAGAHTSSPTSGPTSTVPPHFETTNRY